MVNEVIDRVNLLVNVQGSRRVSKENLEFMFDKYELTEEERKQVFEHCRRYGIAVFSEESEAAAAQGMDKSKSLSTSETQGENEADMAMEKPAKKKSFLGRLLGR